MASLKIDMLIQTLYLPLSLTLFSPYPQIIHDLIKISNENCRQFENLLDKEIFIFIFNFQNERIFFLKKLI